MREALPKPQTRPALGSCVLVTEAMEQALGSFPHALASVAAAGLNAWQAHKSRRTE